MNIYIRGGGFSNKGAESMLKTVQTEIIRRLPGTRFYSEVLESENLFAQINGFTPVNPRVKSFREKLVYALPGGKKFLSAIQYMKRENFYGNEKYSILISKPLQQMPRLSGVIDISGFAYSDQWENLSPLREMTEWLTYCKKAGIPYIFMPQAWGPFQREEVSKLVKQVFEHPSMICSRDHISTCHLQSLPNCDSDKILEVPDIVFKYKDGIRDNGTLSSYFSQSKHSSFIGIVPNMRVYEKFDGFGLDNEYVQVLTKLVKFCISQLNANVILIPNEIHNTSSSTPDDRYLCSIIKSFFPENFACIKLINDMTSAELRALVSGLDFLIASRFHSLVFALAANVPAYALGWSHKYNELMKLFDLDNAVSDHNCFDSNQIHKSIKQLWESRADLTLKIQQRNIHIHKQIDDAFDQVSEILS